MVEQSDIVVGLALLAALVALVMLILLGRRAGPSPPSAAAQTSQAPTRSTKAAKPAPAEPPRNEALLLKFVVDEANERRGETVAFEGDKVVLKDAEGFALVPADSLRLEGDQVRLVGAVDWKAARAEGEAWRERSHKVIEYDESEVPKDD